MSMILAWIFGILGGLSMVMGILTALEVLPLTLINLHFSPIYWLVLAAVLMLICIAALVAGNQSEY